MSLGRSSETAGAISAIPEQSEDSPVRSNCSIHRDDQPRALGLLAVVACTLLAVPALAADEGSEPRKPLASVTTNCVDCGVVRSIREIRTEREAQRPDAYVSSPQYRDTLPAELPRIGPAFSLSWGAGERPRTQIGAVGTPEMKHRYIDITYEVSVRFDDGRFGLIEQDDAGDLRTGDRVIVVNRKVQKVTD
jgi:hypothetical protein